MEYVPNALLDPDSFKAYNSIIESVAKAREHRSYLSVEQLALAIVNGLKVWGDDEDGKVVAHHILDLLGEQAHEYPAY